MLCPPSLSFPTVPLAYCLHISYSDFGAASVSQFGHIEKRIMPMMRQRLQGHDTGSCFSSPFASGSAPSLHQKFPCLDYFNHRDVIPARSLCRKHIRCHFPDTDRNSQPRNEGVKHGRMGGRELVLECVHELLPADWQMTVMGRPKCGKGLSQIYLV